MKKVNRIILLFPVLFFITGCDKDFEAINTNPQAINTISDPGLLLTNILRNTSTAGTWEAEATIVVDLFIVLYVFC